MSAPRLAPRSLRLEALEERRVMAGNVTVKLVAGDVQVVGDGAANGVWISEIASNTYRVTGLEHGGAPTSINGKRFVDIYSPNDDLVVKLNGGNDLAAIGNKVGTMTVEDLNVDMGDGADELEVANIRVYDRTDPARFVLGSSSSKDGKDYLAVENAQFYADVDVVMGNGVDECEFTNVAITDDLRIDTGAGNDEIELWNVAADEVLAALGSGNDRLELANNRFRSLIARGDAGSQDELDLRTGNRFTSRSFSGFEIS